MNFQNMADKNRDLQEENTKLKDESKELRRRIHSLEEKMKNPNRERLKKPLVR